MPVCRHPAPRDLLDGTVDGVIKGRRLVGAGHVGRVISADSVLVLTMGSEVGDSKPQMTGSGVLAAETRVGCLSFPLAS